MQAALDDWAGIAPALAARAEKLEAGLLSRDFLLRDDDLRFYLCRAPANGLTGRLT